MLRKIALICPVAGCPKIGGKTCPTHNREMIREVYVHEPKVLRDVQGFAKSAHEAFSWPPKP